MDKRSPDDPLYQEIQTAIRIETSAIDMETGFRGFLLSGKTEFLAPYENGRRRFDELISQLKVTVSDNPNQVEILEKADAIISTWILAVGDAAIKE